MSSASVTMHKIKEFREEVNLVPRLKGLNDVLVLIAPWHRVVLKCPRTVTLNYILTLHYTSEIISCR